MRFRLFILSLFAVLSYSTAFAQNQAGNPQNSLLPEINPQDIEIRSEFRARFPGLRRQPILGFNPKPRVFRIDPNRMPFMESRDEAVASISVTEMDRPQPPDRSILRTPDRRQAYIRAGFGNFISPELEAYGYKKLDEQSLLSGDLNFRSSEGHLDNQGSAFRYLDINGKYVNKLKQDLKFTTDIGFLSDYNHMFDLESNFLQTPIGKTAEKNYLGFGGGVTLEQVQNSLEGWKLNAGGNLFSVDLDAGSSAFSGELNEQTFYSSFSRYWAGKRMYETFNVSAYVEGGNYEAASLPAQQWIDTKASLQYKRLLNFSAHITGKAGIEYISDGFSEKVYLVPEITLKHNLKDALILTGHAYAKPEMQSIQDHHQYNRFMNTQTRLMHSYKLGARGEIAFQPIEGNRIFGGISYNFVRDYAYYQRGEQQAGGNTARTFYNVNYSNTSIIELFGGITQQLVPEVFWFDFKFYGRSPKLTSGGNIPFEERLGANGSLSYKPVKSLTINAWAEYIGQREDPASTNDLKGYLLLNGGAEYQISERFGLYVKVLNILGQKYEIWQGYQERPLQFFGGLTIKI